MARTIATTRRGAARRQTRSPRAGSSRRRTTRPRAQRFQGRAIKQRTTGQRRQRTDKEVQAFLDHFTACLTAGDGQGAAACFEYPALMVMANAQQHGDNQPLDEVGAVADFFAKAKQMYHDLGIEETFADVQGVEWLADDLALVRARFPYIDSDGNDMGDGETSLYVVRRNDDGMAICAAVTLGTDAERAKGRRRPRGDVGDQRR